MPQLARSRAGWARYALRAAVTILAACSPDRPTRLEPDTLAPRVRVLSPSVLGYDADGNGLVDLRLAWTDSLGTVDIRRVRVRVISGTSPPGADTNLLALWRVTHVDTLGLSAEETTAGLLGSGLVTLEIQVPDTSGNVARDTVTFALPEAVLARTLTTGLPVGFHPADGMALCHDDDRLYVAVGANVWVVDPESLQTVRLVPTTTGITTENLARPLCVADDPYVYLTGFARLVRFDRQTMTFAAGISNSFASVGITQSRADPDLIYEGENDVAVIGVISRSQLTRRRLLSFAPVQTNIDDIAAMPGDAKLYITYGSDGIWVVDPARDSVLQRIRVANPGPAGNGTAQAMALTRDARRLYVAVTYGAPGGIIEIDTQTDSVLRRYNMPGGNPVQLALSPDERRIFVATQDVAPGVASDNVLLEVATMTPIRFFPRPRPAGTTRYDRGVLFRPDGKYIFVAHDTGLDIYLHRQ